MHNLTKPNRSKPLPPVGRVRELLSFSRETGQFVWLKTGNPAGAKRPTGHIYIFIDGQHYGAHRLAYQESWGADPGDAFVDHINHDPSDNRPSNLRLATPQQNTQNASGARSDNAHGARGIRWRARDKRWYAQITIKGKKVYLGSFVDRDAAIAAVSTARLIHFGEFAGKG